MITLVGTKEKEGPLMKEFFGFGGYTRSPEGYLSWQHLLFVTACAFVMIAAAVLLGLKNRNGSDSEKNKALIITAILIDAFELFKIILSCFRSGDPMDWIYNLPLFLCSIQLITIPLAAFSRGRVKEASLDFVVIFGLLGALLGTYGAGNNYAAYPVLSFDNVVSAITHDLSGFAALYILMARMSSMKKKNIPATLAILVSFCIAAYVVNRIFPCNYMFLMQGDGTPYDIVYNWVGGHPILYPLLVVALFFVYIFLYYGVYYFIKGRTSKVKG